MKTYTQEEWIAEGEKGKVNEITRISFCVFGVIFAIILAKFLSNKEMK